MCIVPNRTSLYHIYTTIPGPKECCNGVISGIQIIWQFIDWVFILRCNISVFTCRHMSRVSGWSTSRGVYWPMTTHFSRCLTTILFKAEKLPGKHSSPLKSIVLRNTAHWEFQFKKNTVHWLWTLLFLRWVRGEHFRYKFSQPGSVSAAQGKWWLRKRIGTYFPPLNLEGLRGYFQSRKWPHPHTHPKRTWDDTLVSLVVLQRWRKGHTGLNSGC